MDKLSFSVDKFDLKEVSDNQLMELEVWLVSEGDNAHKMPISLNAIKQAVPTLVGKPVLYKYCKHTKDFEEHESDEVACGVVLSETDMRFEVDESGKSWLICKAYIWKYYYPDVVEVFKRDENKSVSMEISIVDSKDLQDGKVEIVSFVFMGLTLLGNAYRPAIEYAKASVLKFSEMVNETKTILNKTFGIADGEVAIENFVKKEDEEMKLNFNKAEEEVKEIADDSVVEKKEELEKKEEYVDDKKEEEVVEEEKKEEISVDYKSEYEKMCNKYAELEEKFNASENEKVEMSEKNQELQKFKSNIEEQENKAKVEFAIESVSKYFSQEQKDDWRNKVSEFKTIEEFSNAIKAFAFELNSVKDGSEKQNFIRIHIPQAGDENKDKSLWDRI